MKVAELMSESVYTVSAEDTLQHAASLMEDFDIGALPVMSGHRLLGILTDRDIVIRALSLGLGPETPVREVMSRDVECCREGDDVEDALEIMGDRQIRRIVVLSDDGALIGIVSLGDIATAAGTLLAAEALEDISRPDHAYP